VVGGFDLWVVELDEGRERFDLALTADLFLAKRLQLGFELALRDFNLLKLRLEAFALGLQRFDVDGHGTVKLVARFTSRKRASNSRDKAAKARRQITTWRGGHGSLFSQKWVGTKLRPNPFATICSSTHRQNTTSMEWPSVTRGAARGAFGCTESRWRGSWSDRVDHDGERVRVTPEN